MKKKEVIVVAGGVGKRMESSVPKQFLRLKDEIILIKTIRLFYELDRSAHIVVTLPAKEIEKWNNICKTENFNIPHTIAKGGETRFHSVRNALSLIEGDSLVAIHDGVRPLVSKGTILRAFEKADRKGSAIPVTDIYESIRYIKGNETRNVNREYYKMVQTPQVFDSQILSKAYETNYMPEFTDDASVVEKTGNKIHVVKGNPENIKITTKKDLAIAEALIPFIENQVD